jgi:flavin-dependent thymidylate synthase
MKVTLIKYDQDAADILIFTKSTRLNMTPGLMDEIRAWPEERKLAELEYMANTIPSSWEFTDYVFLVEGVSRAYTHQQVRTRSASYAQQSMRIVDMKDFEYVFTKRNLEDDLAYDTIDGIVDQIKDAYQRLINMGQPPEDARGILPTNIATNIVCKFNLRTLTELVRSRSGGRTQGEYQDVVKAMADEVLKVHPWAATFLFPKGRDRYDEIEAFAEREFGGNLAKKGELLKIVDKMRKGE